MPTNRLEAFSDGVIAIIITIMVLELKVPHGGDVSALRPLLPVFLSYILSFIYIGIYWNNHHHLFQIAEKVSGAVLWANLHLLFWLSLVPFVTAWMGENHFSMWTVAFYGVVLLMNGLAYFVLTIALSRLHGREARLTRALGNDLKGKVSVAVYALAISLAFVNQWMALALYGLVALIWLVPDRRVESNLAAPSD